MNSRPAVVVTGADPIDALANASKLYADYVRLARLSSFATPPQPVQQYPLTSNKASVSPRIAMSYHAILGPVTS